MKRWNSFVGAGSRDGRGSPSCVVAAAGWVLEDAAGTANGGGGLVMVGVLTGELCTIGICVPGSCGASPGRGGMNCACAAAAMPAPISTAMILVVSFTDPPDDPVTAFFWPSCLATEAFWSPFFEGGAAAAILAQLRCCHAESLD